MKGLLRKELYMVRKYLWSYLLLVGVFLLAVYLGKDPRFLLFPGMVAGMIPISLMTYDTHFRWDAYSATMPYTRIQLVSVKYLVGVLSVMGIFLLNGGVLLLRQILQGDGDVGQMLAFSTLILVLGLLPSWLMLPLAFCLGPEQSRIITGVLIAMISFLGTFVYSAGYLFPMAEIPGWGVLLTVASAVILYLFSWGLSIYLYKKKEF